MDGFAFAVRHLTTVKLADQIPKFKNGLKRLFVVCVTKQHKDLHRKYITNYTTFCKTVWKVKEANGTPSVVSWRKRKDIQSRVKTYCA